MQERVIEIILFLISELRSDKRLNDVDISLLTRNGYTQSEISSAFSWFFEKLSVEQSPVNISESTSSSYRMLSKNEKMIIDTQAHGYLIQCQQLGLLTNFDIEIIIERIHLAGFTSVGISEMKSFVAGYLFDTDNNN